MHSLPESLRALSPTNRVLIGVGVVAVVLWAWTTLQARWRDREHTVYTLPDDSTFGHEGGRAVGPPESEDPAAKAPAPPAESDAMPRSGDEAGAPAEDAPDDANAPEPDGAVASEAPRAGVEAPPWTPDWAEGRRLCPCCGYATDYTPAHRCSLCDWGEPPEPVLDDDHPTPPNPDDLLDEAQTRYRATGSALTPEVRAAWIGPPTPAEIELRRKLHDRLEYLRTGDRPDSSETWEAIGRIIDDLHREQEREGLDS